MSTREALLNKFLGTGAWKQAQKKAFEQDASCRRYFRLTGGPQPALLMDSPPAQEALTPFVKISQHLRSLHLSAPEIYQLDEENGFAIIEDFGDATFTQLLANDASEETLYLLATDCLIALHNKPGATEIELPRRESTLLEEAMLFCDWFYPALKGHPCPDSVRNSFAQTWHSILQNRNWGTDTLVLRDFHVDNTMLLSGRSGVKRCGLLDFQDATIGPAPYDVMSLLEDARRDVAPACKQSCLQRYLANSSVVGDEGEFLSNCAVLAAQRHTRVAAVFVRLSQRDNKHHYLPHLSRVTRLLRQHLDHPALAELRGWLLAHLPEFDNDAPIS